MKCPICKIDLSPLDLVSRHEHVELCVENGPTVVDIGESGKLVMKKHVPPNKQRRICPICDKTFMTIHLHFKTCALKNDLTPQLMLEHWDKINSETQTNKRFPRDLLDSFVAKCIKEGRVGEQVDFAKALSLSLAEQEPETTSVKRTKNGSVIQQQQTNINDLVTDEDTNQSVASTSSSVQQQVTRSDAGEQDQEQANRAQAQVVDLDQILMQSSSTDAFNEEKRANKKKYMLEVVDEATRLHNIELRMDRELTVSRRRRYLEALKSAPPSSQEGLTQSSQEAMLSAPTQSSQEARVIEPTQSDEEHLLTSPTQSPKKYPTTPPTQSSQRLPLTTAAQSSQGSSIIISD